MFAAGQVDSYDRQSARYDRAHSRWLRFAGGEAQCAFEGAVSALLAPGRRILDAACGTGAMARRIVAGAPGPLQLTLLDASPRMLARCDDIPATRIQASLETMPFADDSFDIVLCAWAIETVEDPARVSAELLRVCRSGGCICLAFCADRPSRSIIGFGLRQHVTVTGLGRFLDPATVRDLFVKRGAAGAHNLFCAGPAAAMIIRK